MVDKRTFLAALTCPTQGWYAARAERTPLTPDLEWRFHTGQEVGRLARTELGPGRQLPASIAPLALDTTRQAIADPSAAILFEASFSAAGCSARADVLRRRDPGWQVIEVKSGKTPEAGDPPRPDYLADLAYTVFVARAAGLAVTGASLVLLAREYRLDGTASALTEVDATDQVLPMADLFLAAAPALVAAIEGFLRPEPDFRFVCKECPFFETDCLGRGIADPLFVLPRLSEQRFEQLKRYVRVSCLPPDTALTPPQARVAAVLRAGAPAVDTERLAPLAALEWPVRYLDFESVNPGLPWFPDVAPYEAMPFQYSLHSCAAPGEVSAHHEYLAPTEGDWRRELAEHLLARLGDRGAIMTYSAYERGMLGYLGRVLPDLAPAIAGVRARLFDLEPVIRTGYVHPEFHGRSSIKQVLPVLVPGLSYESLAIGDGGDATGVFGLMRVGRYPAVDHPRHRQALLEYCRLDTLAMVELHAALTLLLPG